MEETSSDEVFQKTVQDFTNVEVAVNGFRDLVISVHRQTRLSYQEMLKLLKSISEARNKDFEYDKKIISLFEQELRDVIFPEWVIEYLETYNIAYINLCRKRTSRRYFWLEWKG